MLWLLLRFFFCCCLASFETCFEDVNTKGCMMKIAVENISSFQAQENMRAEWGIIMYYIKL